MHYARLLIGLLLILPFATSTPGETDQRSSDITSEDRNAQLRAAVNQNRADLVRQLIANGADPNACGPECPIIVAAIRSTEVLRELLRAGANPNLLSEKYSYSALGTLANYQREDFVRYQAEGTFTGPIPDVSESALMLIAAGADVNHVDGFGESPLRTAVRVDNVDAARIFIKSGADLNYRMPPRSAFQLGDTILMAAIDQAVHQKSTELLQLLLDSGADPNIRNEMPYDQDCESKGGCGWKGYSPLAYAARHGYADIVSLLLIHGARPDSQRTDGQTALQLARANNHPKTAEIIEKYSHSARHETLCNTSETTYLTCLIGNKLLSVCGSEQITKESGYLRYLFGELGKRPELIHPDKEVHPSTVFRRNEPLTSAKAGVMALAFDISDFTYNVFSTRSAFGYNGAGVIVQRGEQQIALKECRLGTVSDDRFFFDLADAGIPIGAVRYVGPEQ